MKRLSPLVLVSLLTWTANAAVVFSYPPSSSGGVILSSWLDPNGSDADMYAYNDFTLPSNAAITEVRWRGGYQYGGIYGKIWDFSIYIYESAVGGTQPHVNNPQLQEIYLARYQVGGTANETPAGTFGGVAMYDYSFTLPTAFQATGGTKYWIRIEASQIGYPDWGLAVGTGGDGQHFQFSTGAARFSYGSGDTSFSLLTLDTPTFSIVTSPNPTSGGTTTGDGVFPSNSTLTVTATPSLGYVFANWTENGVAVSGNANYTFTLTTDRNLVANFARGAVITTASWYGGTTAGDGTYALGSTVALTATPNPGYNFLYWMENGVPVSLAANYTFTASADRTLYANFVLSPTTAIFDFDTGTPAVSPTQGMPASQTWGGVTAHFTDTGGDGFSVQSDATTQYHLPLFSGNYLYPNSQQFRAALDIQFSRPVTNMSFNFCTADFQQVEVPTSLLLTAYTNSSATPSVASATAHGTYGTGTMPMGTLVLNSPTPFNLARITIPYCAACSSIFFVDNIIVQTTGGDTNYSITTAAFPAEGGSTAGGAVYPGGAEVNVVAVANPGYAFLNWTESGSAIALSDVYTFAATANQNLMANFAPICTLQKTATNTVLISWPSPATGYVLQENTALGSAWVNATNPVSVGNGQKQVTISPTGNRFYRLFHP